MPGRAQTKDEELAAGSVRNLQGWCAHLSAEVEKEEDKPEAGGSRRRESGPVTGLTSRLAKASAWMKLWMMILIWMGQDRLPVQSHFVNATGRSRSPALVSEEQREEQHRTRRETNG